MEEEWKQWAAEHDGRINAWWEAQHDWNAKVEARITVLEKRVTAIEIRIAMIAGVAAILGSLLGQFIRFSVAP